MTKATYHLLHHQFIILLTNTGIQKDILDPLKTVAHQPEVRNHEDIGRDFPEGQFDEESEANFPNREERVE